MKPHSKVLIVLIVVAAAAANASDRYSIGLDADVVGPTGVAVTITSNLPGTVDVMVSLDLAGQEPDDIYIGTSKRTTLKDGQAEVTLQKDGLPRGKYEVEVSFFPKWGPQDATAKSAGLDSELHARQTVTLEGTGESADAAQQREQNQLWVMKNANTGTQWNRSYWVERFGEPNQLTVSRWNPRVMKAYYFQSLDMTIFVNEIKGEISHWRMGHATQ